jgi:hypothetical protein
MRVRNGGSKKERETGKEDRGRNEGRKREIEETKTENKTLRGNER